MRTPRQQTALDVVNGAGNEMRAPIMKTARRMDLGRQLGTVAGWLAEEFPAAALLRTGDLGIDASVWQGNVGWGRVAAAGRRFAIVKASEGVGFTDDTFRANWAGMAAAGLVRGAYHFARPDLDGNSAADEAEYFLGVVAAAGGAVAGSDVLALDLETGDGDLAAWALAWLRVVRAAGHRPVLYTSPSFIAEHGLSGVPELAEFPLWLASYRATVPPCPAGWDRIAIWQRTSSGVVEGVAGMVDENVVLAGLY